ncbi:hypothetical protein CTheo_8134 [Ceratobasidium theobromae]|uniref:Uncharacterized protein n=1 Tax=Ceratobasidium theobromae TaxID=1582974 RepID=A0A5N5QAJ2_9AGAM|nr:hypothetical protein CTheo_8134 [Ceratobasidium theobromae]
MTELLTPKGIKTRRGRASSLKLPRPPALSTEGGLPLPPSTIAIDALLDSFDDLDSSGSVSKTDNLKRRDTWGF